MTRCMVSVSDRLTIRRSGNSLVVFVTGLADALGVDFGDEVEVTLSVELEGTGTEVE